MKTHLLIVDDEPVLARMAAALLEDQNYRIIRAENGRQAMEMAVSKKPEIILSDLVMPGMDGYQLLQWVRQNNIPAAFVLMTVKSSALGLIARGQYKPDALLSKPFDRRRLLRALEVAMKKQSLRDVPGRSEELRERRS